MRAADEELRPSAFALHPCEPNPFQHSTRIRFDLPRPTTVRLEVFDLQGRRLATLASGALPVGFHSREWDGRKDAGGHVRPGVYLYRLIAGEYRSQKKLIVLKRGVPSPGHAAPGCRRASPRAVRTRRPMVLKAICGRA